MPPIKYTFENQRNTDGIAISRSIEYPYIIKLNFPFQGSFFIFPLHSACFDVLPGISTSLDRLKLTKHHILQVITLPRKTKAGQYRIPAFRQVSDTVPHVPHPPAGCQIFFLFIHTKSQPSRSAVSISPVFPVSRSV